MKKIFYILASAIVALGAVACENDGLDNIGLEVNGDTVSFIASIDNNRTDLDGLKTIWDEDDTISITWTDANGERTDVFSNKGTGNKYKFSCEAKGLLAIQNANVVATYSHEGCGTINSAVGTQGALLRYEGSFTDIKFEVQNAFLKFTAEEGVVITASEGLFDEKTAKTFEVTKENAGEIYVAVNAGVPATLSYKVGENEGKNLSTTFEKGVIYNLGSLTKAVAKDNKGKFYTSLADAFKLAENGATISLLGDIVLESGVTVAAGKEYTLDLAGKTLSLVSNVMGGYLIQNNGVLTIGNGTVDYTYNGEADNTYGKGNYVITNRGTLTIESDATIINKTASMAHANYAIDNISVSADTALTVKGTVSFVNGTAIRQCTSGKANSLNVEDGATIVAKTYGIQIFLSTSDATVAPEVDLTITGGTISGEYAITSVSMGNSFENVNITIEGGVLNGDVAFTTFYNEENHSVETVTISGGEFNMKNYGLYSYGLWFDDATLVESINITGGTYNMAPENAYYGNLLAEGYAAKNNGNGTYTVAEVTYVAQVGETKYEDINDAIANAGGSTVELLANIEGTVTLDKACTININGKTFYYTVEGDFRDDVDGNVITISPATYVLYVTNTMGWSKLNIYAWSDSMDAPTWPGVEMEYDEENEVYYYDFGENVGKFNYIINDGVDQTPDLSATMTTKGVEYDLCGNTFLTPGCWNVDGAWFAAYFHTNGKWAKMYDGDGDGIYACYNPNASTGCNMVRMSSGTASSTESSRYNWGNKWNQTNDVTLNKGNHIKITGWNQANFTQSTK